MPKPSIYLDASFISTYWYKGANPAMLGRRFHSREWWILERRHFCVLASEFVSAELGFGNYRWQSNCLSMVRRLGFLQRTGASNEIMEALLAKAVIPPEQRFDAAHLAISTAYNVDYLLTWNYAHLANPLVQQKLNVLCQDRGLRPPLLVSPETIPQARFGQTTRRRKRK